MKNIEWSKDQKIAVGIIGIILLLIIIVVVLNNKEETPSPVQQPKTQVVKRVDRCKTTETSISYSVLEEKDRKSDVPSISIHECYILIDKIAPTIIELTNLATVLGTGVDNIEFEIFDSKEAYVINKRYQEILKRNGKDSEISKSEWAIWDNHYLARYLKANTTRRNNYFWTISDIYSGQENVLINN
jgi:hypothetical protein